MLAQPDPKHENKASNLSNIRIHLTTCSTWCAGTSVMLLEY